MKKTYKDTDPLLRFIRMADRAIGRIFLVFLAAVAAFAIYAMLDLHQLTSRGAADAAPLHDCDKLLKTNPDFCGWLTLEGSRISQPVVQGKDNWEYLDKDFYGKYYAGGSLFLDSRNNRHFQDEYNIIYGHNMDGGAMFGNLDLYEDRNFFERHSRGLMETVRGNYKLTVFAVMKTDAYGIVFAPGRMTEDLKKMIRKQAICYRKTAFFSSDRVLALTTCTDTMDDSRTAVFCRMRPERSDEK